MDPTCLLRKIREEIVRELELQPEHLTDTDSLRDYGMDSVAAVTIIFRLESELGIDIDVRKLAGVDTIEGLKLVISREFSEQGRHCVKQHG